MFHRLVAGALGQTISNGVENMGSSNVDYTAIESNSYTSLISIIQKLI